MDQKLRELADKYEQDMDRLRGEMNRMFVTSNQQELTSMKDYVKTTLASLCDMADELYAAKMREMRSPRKLEPKKNRQEPEV